MGPTAAVYVSAPLSGQRLDAIHDYLVAAAQDVQTTRKGRVWHAVFEGGVFTVDVQETRAVACDCESNLANLGLREEEAPWRVLLTAPTNQSCDWRQLERVASELARLLGGFATAASK